MHRIILFLVLVTLAAAGAAWVAEQGGDVALTWHGWRVETTLPVFALALGATIVAAMLVWSALSALWRTPGRIRRTRRERRLARGRHAITHGLLAIGHGDQAAARAHATVARRHAAHDPLSLLLHAQAAQLEGDRAGARAAFRAMAEREDTRLLGLRGLFIEAQRADDLVSAVAIAEEALRLSSGSTWASQAVLGYRCAKGDWSGALAILDNNLASGLIDKSAYRRQRGVLLTARAIELETVDRDLSRDSVMEAIKLAPTLVPAAVLAGKYESEAHQVRRSMRIVEAAWLNQPHPDLAEAYAHVRLGDSARQRLVRVETLAAKAPGHLESALALARAAIDASEFTRAREALTPFVEAPTQRVAMLMAEIERTEHGDSGRARAWTLRAVHARHDPVWTADGYVSDRWRPVSPVSGRLDAFVWQTPVAALPSEKNAAIEAKEFDETPPALRRVEPPREPSAATGPAQDNWPERPAAVAPESEPATVTPPLFRARRDAAKDSVKSAPSPIPPVIPIVRPPDDPGIDDEAASDEFAEQIHPTQGQAGGWRGFLSRWGG
ncbi:MAG TPA: heme biosynthesis HemY N-terminal domain-containing protein [Bradyrhizobium sp.]|nr:heme biosynthesis HemY N-terminal domain-containing protein [Bradyrhizobium sp.]